VWLKLHSACLASVRSGFYPSNHTHTHKKRIRIKYSAQYTHWKVATILEGIETMFPSLHKAYGTTLPFVYVCVVCVCVCVILEFELRAFHVLDRLCAT
jgi:hypothetical protein